MLTSAGNHRHQSDCTGLAPLPQIQLIFHQFFLCVYPSQLGSFSLLVDPKLGKTFNVDCTLPVSSLVTSHSDLFVAVLLYSWRHGPIWHEGPAIWRLAECRKMPGNVHRGIHVVLPKEVCLLPLLSLWHHCLSPVHHRPHRRPRISPSFSVIVGHSVGVPCRASLVTGSRTRFGLA